MPRSYQSGTGVSMSGRTYEPQVSPWERNEDDVDVYQGTTYDRDRQASGRYGQDDDFAPSAGDRRSTQYRGRDDYRRDDYRQSGYGSNDRQDAYTRRDLQPTYQDAYERDRERYGRTDDDRRAYRGANRDRDYDRDLLGDRREDDRRDHDDRHEDYRANTHEDDYRRDRDRREDRDRPWTGFARGYDSRR